VVELHTSAMALYESETPRVVDKFNGDNFSLFKFKMEMILNEKDLLGHCGGNREGSIH
jgi:hypothetical protein